MTPPRFFAWVLALITRVWAQLSEPITAPLAEYGPACPRKLSQMYTTLAGTFGRRRAGVDSRGRFVPGGLSAFVNVKESSTVGIERSSVTRKHAVDQTGVPWGKTVRGGSSFSLIVSPPFRTGTPVRAERNGPAFHLGQNRSEPVGRNSDFPVLIVPRAAQVHIRGQTAPINLTVSLHNKLVFQS
jgi:hypothetical protein